MERDLNKYDRNKSNRTRKRKKRKKHVSSSPLVTGLVLVMAVLMIFALGLRMLMGTPEGAETTIPEETIPQASIPEASVPEASEKPGFFQRIAGLFAKETEPTLPPEPEHVIAEAKISVTGDILMHLPVINTGLQDNGSYNFDPIFQYLLPYTTDADYSVANLETTLCGTEGGYKYSGYPAFNCPDEIVTALKNAGFDLLLTANNHCYDTGEYGFLRTVRTVRQNGLEVLGTKAAPEEPSYRIKDINGIKIGMVCYTYEGRPENPKDGVIYMNKNPLSSVCAPLINSFLSENLDPFYLEMRQCIEDMKNAGAEATVLFIHWGTEYQTSAELLQQNMAQQLCDIGFDVIVGGHPHVVQPVALLTSRVDPDRKTVCLYSTGNAISNQRIKEMDLKTGHTEDGVLFSATFSKYSDGTVYLQDVELLPCWVDMTTVSGHKEYHILPLQDAIRADWQSLYQLDDQTLENAKKSYDRTITITGSGMEESRAYLAAQKEQREADYLAAVTPELEAA